MMENSEAALKREMLEELELEVRTERLLWVAETFFEHENQKYHEMGFYFLIHLCADKNSSVFEKEKMIFGKEVGQPYKLIYQWFALEDLENVLLYPTFTRAELQNLSTNIKHVIVHE
ncbi:NUDIX domain-containing protein, partial [Paenibacillus elgii]